MEHLPYKSLYMSSYYRNASKCIEICLTLATSTLSSLATLDVLFLRYCEHGIIRGKNAWSHSKNSMVKGNL